MVALQDDDDWIRRPEEPEEADIILEAYPVDYIDAQLQLNLESLEGSDTAEDQESMTDEEELGMDESALIEWINIQLEAQLGSVPDLK